MIKITSPKHKAVVPKNVQILGRSPVKTPVQVYVLAHDHKWYLQKEVIHKGKKWSCDCVLGDETMPPDGIYVVLAVKTAERPKTPLDDIPCGERSNAIILQVKK